MPTADVATTVIVTTVVIKPRYILLELDDELQAQVPVAAVSRSVLFSTMLDSYDNLPFPSQFMASFQDYVGYLHNCSGGNCYQNKSRSLCQSCLSSKVKDLKDYLALAHLIEDVILLDHLVNYQLFKLSEERAIELVAGIDNQFLQDEIYLRLPFRCLPDRLRHKNSFVKLWLQRNSGLNITAFNNVTYRSYAAYFTSSYTDASAACACGGGSDGCGCGYDSTTNNDNKDISVLLVRLSFYHQLAVTRDGFQQTWSPAGGDGCLPAVLNYETYYKYKPAFKCGLQRSWHDDGRLAELTEMDTCGRYHTPGQIPIYYYRCCFR